MRHLILDRLNDLRAQSPQAPFIQTADHSFSRQAFWDESRCVGARLRQACDNSEQHTIAIHEFEPRYFFVYLVGIWMAGYRVLPLNIRMPAATIARCIEKTGCNIAIGSQSSRPPGVDCEYLPLDAIEPDSTTGLPDLPADDAMIMLTSGSTGEPKAIPLTSRQLLDNALATQQVVGLEPADKLLITMPPCFITGIAHFMSCVVSGACLLSVTGFNFGEQLIRLIREHGVTAFGGSPTNIRRLLAAAPDTGHLGKLGICISSGDHLAADEQQMFLDRYTRTRLIYMYGLSEVGGRFCVNDLRTSGKIGSPGRPIAGMSLVARSPDGRDLPAGESGEITISGPMLMAGYLQEDGGIDVDSVVNGFATGDLGHVDEDGYLYIIGRTNDVLKIGGEKVSIPHVENAIRQNLDCADCTVAVIDDPNLGKVLIGLVVPDPGESRIDIVALMKQLRIVLPPNALPARILEVEAVPRTGSGKVARQEASALALGLLKQK